jgi:PIN domain nuclease of toxin-antitoxin system
MRLLLDTCTFLWVVGGAPDLSPAVAEAVADPGNDVYLSAASALEIAVKHGRGRLSLPEAPDRYVPGARTRHAIDPLPIDEESALHVAKLEALHRDPFDRLLVSQAIVHGLTIATPDPLIRQYPARSFW